MMGCVVTARYGRKPLGRSRLDAPFLLLISKTFL